MTLEETIRDMQRCYPSLFASRKQCLDQLFCTNGNGYEWVNGQLVSDRGFPTDEELAERRQAEDIRDLTLARTMDARVAEACAEQGVPYVSELPANDAEALAQMRQKSADWDHRTAPHLEKMGFYPLCPYAKLACVPDDIQDDWLAGVFEILALVIAHEPYDPMSDDPFIRKSILDDEKTVRNNRAFAERVQAELRERFKERKLSC